MAKQKKHRRHSEFQNRITFTMKQFPDDECTDIPRSYINLPLTAEAFSVGLYLYYSRQYLSDHFPGAQGVASVLKMDLDITVQCMKELEDNGVLFMHKDGTFTMNEDPGNKSSI